MASTARKPSAETPTSTHGHRLRRLFVLGGFLDRVNIEFAPGLNCIIGGRGTGKTTALEFVRFALDAMPQDPAGRNRAEALVKQNLSSGRIELGIGTRDGVGYVVSRSTGEPPVVFGEDRTPTSISLKAGAFFGADIFSQSEVESIADSPAAQLALIDSFEGAQIAEIERDIRHVLVELASNAGGIGPLTEKIAALKEELDALPGLETKLKDAAGGGGDSDAVGRAQSDKALRDRERRAVDAVSVFLADHGRAVGDPAGRLGQEAARLFTKELMEGPNKAILAETLNGLQECARMVDAALQTARGLIEAEQRALAERSAELTAAHSAQDLAFRELIEKHHAEMKGAVERAQLEKARNDLLAKKHDLTEAEGKRKRLLDERLKLLARLKELRDRRFHVRQQVANQITTKLAPDVRVGVLQEGDRSAYRALLEQALYGTKTRITVIQKIVESMWPADLAAHARKKDAAGLTEEAGLSPEQAERVIGALESPDVLPRLDTVELGDQPQVALNDGGTYKDSQALSTGQKCTAILPILLLESGKPLLIDQPEDNLDNSFISDAVVKNLRSMKARRQMIFVTHNPNIPVLGDAERVFVLESDGKTARLAKAGTVDECKEEIVTLLEGGEKAFKLRHARYKY